MPSVVFGRPQDGFTLVLKLRLSLPIFIAAGGTLAVLPLESCFPGAKEQRLTWGQELLVLGPPFPQLALGCVDTFHRGVCLAGGSGFGLRGPQLGSDSHSFWSGTDLKAGLYISAHPYI